MLTIKDLMMDYKNIFSKRVIALAALLFSISVANTVAIKKGFFSGIFNKNIPVATTQEQKSKIPKSDIKLLNSCSGAFLIL